MTFYLQEDNVTFADQIHKYNKSMSLTEIIVDFAEPRQKVIEARPVVSDILLQHLDIGLMPDLCTIALHQNDLNVTILLKHFLYI